MKTFVTALIASTMLTGVSFAQGAADRSADQLNARQLELIRPRVATPAPAPARAAAPVAPATQQAHRSGLYVGVATGYGGSHMDTGQWSAGGAVGYELIGSLRSKLQLTMFLLVVLIPLVRLFS
jgi:hypothetical protein